MGNLTNITGAQAVGNWGDITTTPTSTQQYDLGRTIDVRDDSYTTVKRFIYVKSHAALTLGVPYAIVNSGTSGAEWVTAAIGGAISTLVGFPQVAFTSGYYGWVQIAGNLTAVITATSTATAGQAYNLATSGVALTNTTGTVNTANTIAYLVTSTTAAIGSMNALGIRATITT